MKMRAMICCAHVVAAAVLPSLGSSKAEAAEIFNTGVNANGAPLPVGAVDTHWTVISGPGVTMPFSAVASSIFGLYVVTTDSTWIWTNAAASASRNSPYTFRTSFTLTAEEASNTTLSGAWAADNFGDVKLNGANPNGTGTFSLTGAVIENFNQLYSFSITSGFVAGTNTLDFNITDTGGVAGLNVSRLAITPVPEVSTLSMFAVGFAGAVLILRRRNSPSAA